MLSLNEFISLTRRKHVINVNEWIYNNIHMIQIICKNYYNQSKMLRYILFCYSKFSSFLLLQKLGLLFSFWILSRDKGIVNWKIKQQKSSLYFTRKCYINKKWKKKKKDLSVLQGTEINLEASLQVEFDLAWRNFITGI